MQSAHFTQERPTGCGNFVLVRLRLKTDPSSCFILCCSLFAASSFDSSTSSMWSETRSLLSQRSVTYWERCLSFSLSILFSLSLSLCLSVCPSVCLSVAERLHCRCESRSPRVEAQACQDGLIGFFDFLIARAHRLKLLNFCFSSCFKKVPARGFCFLNCHQSVVPTSSEPAPETRGQVAVWDGHPNA